MERSKNIHQVIFARPTPSLSGLTPYWLSICFGSWWFFLQRRGKVGSSSLTIQHPHTNRMSNAHHVKKKSQFTANNALWLNGTVLSSYSSDPGSIPSTEKLMNRQVSSLSTNVSTNTATAV